MDSWGVVFLGIIAFSTAVQAVVLYRLARGGQRLARRLDELQERVDRDLRPGLENLARVSRNLAEFTDLAVLQARRLDGLIADTVDKIEETTALLRRVVVRPLRPLMDVVAFLKGVRRGLQVYRQLRGFENKERHGRRYTEDEHLFI
jgi:hypothetical protein